MSEFKGQLGKYRIISTNDDSPTLWSEFFDENCHSTHGAYAETLFNYVEACRIKGANTEKKILEIGFGLGQGLKATLEHASSVVHFVSLELDPELVEWAKSNLHIEGFSWEQLNKTTRGYEAHLPNGNTVTVLIGDARKTLLDWKDFKFDAIYQDPFSPKKNPTLWTREWFELLAMKSNEHVVMATYSASVGVRKAMLEAGWHPQSLKGFGPKRERTLGTLVGPVDQELERRLRASAAPALRDQAI